MAPAQRLDAALEHAHHNSQHPELPLVLQEKGKQRNARIGCDADRDEGARGVLPAQPPEHQCRGEGHDLGNQQRQQQAGGVQPQGRAVGRGHINDGVYAIDVAEKGQQEPEHLPVLFQVAEGVADAGKALPDGMFLHLHKVHLLILAQQGQGGHQPPDGGDKESKVQRRHLGDADAPSPQHQRQTDHKGHTAANVAPGIAFGGDLIHPVRHSHIAEHGVIEHQTARKAHLGKDEDEQERQPGACHPHGAAADHTHCHAEGEDGLFEVAGIGQCAKDRAEHRRDDCDRRGCIAPVGQILHRAQAAPLSQCVEEDGDQRCHQQHKRRVAHIV